MVLSHFQIGDHSFGWIVAGVLAAVVLLVQRLNSQRGLSRFPLLGGKEYGNRRKRIEAFMARPTEVYKKGYELFKEQIYRLNTPDGEHLIIPERYLDELRTKSDDEIDVLKAFEDMLANDEINLFPPKDRTEVANSIVKVELTRNLVRLNPRLSEEVDQTVNAEFPACEDWTPLSIFNVILRIVAIVSGNIFVGPDLCRHEVYLNAALKFTTDTAAATQEVKRFPKWFRSAAVRLGLCPSIQKAQAHRRALFDLFKPMLEERKALMEADRPVPDDLFQWMLEKSMKHGIVNLQHLTDMQLLIIFAAIHTTTLSATAMMYDIAMLPEVTQDIRKEISTVLKETDGVMTSQALFNMKLLDSFMRESQRFTPPFTDSFKRYVRKPITLKDGTRIPAGTFIDTPSFAVLHDPEHYTDPDTFDAYRFYNLRTKKDTPDPNDLTNREQYQFSSVTRENTAFGFGKHACPGRFFAANEIKLIMARVLLTFDIRYPLDVKERYPNFYAGSISGPNPLGIVDFKRTTKA